MEWPSWAGEEKKVRKSGVRSCGFGRPEYTSPPRDGKGHSRVARDEAGETLSAAAETKKSLRGLDGETPIDKIFAPSRG